MHSKISKVTLDFAAYLTKDIDSVDDLTGTALVTISANPKIFSNGMDLVNIKGNFFIRFYLTTELIISNQISKFQIKMKRNLDSCLLMQELC